MFDIIVKSKSRCGAAGSARALGARCRRFESCHLDHFGSKKQFLEPFFFDYCDAILRVDDCFCQPFVYSIMLDKLDFDCLLF